jgi:hypothetical protein
MNFPSLVNLNLAVESGQEEPPLSGHFPQVKGQCSATSGRLHLLGLFCTQLQNRQILAPLPFFLVLKRSGELMQEPPVGGVGVGGVGVGGVGVGGVGVGPLSSKYKSIIA